VILVRERVIKLEDILKTPDESDFETEEYDPITELVEEVGMDTDTAKLVMELKNTLEVKSVLSNGFYTYAILEGDKKPEILKTLSQYKRLSKIGENKYIHIGNGCFILLNIDDEKITAEIGLRYGDTEEFEDTFSEP